MCMLTPTNVTTEHITVLDACVCAFLLWIFEYVSMAIAVTLSQSLG